MAQRVVTKCPTKFTWVNQVYVSPNDPLASQMISINDIVYKANPIADIPNNHVGLSMWQRQSVKGEEQMRVNVKAYERRAIIYQLDLKVYALKERRRIAIKEVELEAAIKNIFQDFAFSVGQRVGMKFQNQKILVEVLEIQVLNDSRNSDTKTKASADVIDSKTGFLDSKSKSKINIKPDESNRFLQFEKNKERKGLTLGPDFLQKMGIGGLDEEFSNIFRRAFISRMFPPEVIKRLGIKHAKGMLLYGPPGTGKTLIARQIGKMLDGREPVIINGPEVLNKFVGKTEENIRLAFKPAEDDQDENGDNADLHIIIFDEIDAICKQRGSGGSGAGGSVGDTVVNQLLTKLDGVKQLNNVLVIGMTNRKDMIDSALLRSGRLEIHVEIGLPDEKGREQIFRIHTADLKKAGQLAADVDIKELARLTKNYSGAEIMGVKNSAASFCMYNGIDTSSGGAVIREDVDVNTLQVTMDHFLAALDEVQPDFGSNDEELSACMPGGILAWSDLSEALVEDAAALVEVVKEQNRTNHLSILLEGPHGTGKTALAAKIAIASEFPYIKMIRPDDLIGYHDHGRVAKINRVFEDAYKSPLSLIILDNIERLIEYVPIGPRFSNPVLQALLVLIKKRPPEGKKLLVIGTTASFRIFEDFDLKQAFNTVISVPHLTDGKHVQNVFKQLKIPVAPKEMKQIVAQCPVPLGIKQLLMVIELARQGSEAITADVFMQCCAECRLVRASYMI